MPLDDIWAKEVCYAMPQAVVSETTGIVGFMTMHVQTSVVFAKAGEQWFGLVGYSSHEEEVVSAGLATMGLNVDAGQRDPAVTSSTAGYDCTEAKAGCGHGVEFRTGK